MNIGTVAKKTGLSTTTIRFYEEKKLISEPGRTENGYRYYSPQQVEELLFLQHARQIGFNLDECSELLDFYRNPSRHSADVKARTLQKVNEIEKHIFQLQTMRDQLIKLAQQCPGNEGAECPIINELSGCCSEKTAL